MDKILVCGTSALGSIPSGSTNGWPQKRMLLGPLPLVAFAGIERRRLRSRPTAKEAEAEPCPAAPVILRAGEAK